MTSRNTALVTGAASGIGRSAVLALARAGYDVAINYASSEKAARETAAEAQKLGAKTLLVKCDVADEAAVVNLTKTLAWNLGPEIRVNAVAPGWMEGDWMKRMLQDKYEDLMGKRAKSTPLKRVVTADDVAETMMSLIQSNRFVTGEIIVIDGGFTSST